MKEEKEEVTIRYWRDGVAVLRQIVDVARVNHLRSLASKLHREAHMGRVRDGNVSWRDQNGTRFLEKLEPITSMCPEFFETARDPSIMRNVRKLMGAPAVSSFADKLIYKAPLQDGFPLHQDYNPVFGRAPDETCTVALPLDAVDSENGGIQLLLGSHRMVSFPLQREGALGWKEEAPSAITEYILPELYPGDILVFHSLTLHYSARNDSDRWRRIFYLACCSLQTAGHVCRISG